MYCSTLACSSAAGHRGADVLGLEERIGLVLGEHSDRLAVGEGARSGRNGHGQRKRDEGYASHWSRLSIASATVAQIEPDRGDDDHPGHQRLPVSLNMQQVHAVEARTTLAIRSAPRLRCR
jgi:hypothetical protein